MDNWYKTSQETDQLKLDFDFDNTPFNDPDPWVPVKSSFIDSVAYYDSAGVLEVRLTSGQIYTFMDVPYEIYDTFMQSPSKGAFFNQIIRKKYSKQ